MYLFLSQMQRGWLCFYPNLSCQQQCCPRKLMEGLAHRGRMGYLDPQETLDPKVRCKYNIVFAKFLILYIYNMLIAIKNICVICV